MSSTNLFLCIFSYSRLHHQHSMGPQSFVCQLALHSSLWLHQAEKKVYEKSEANTWIWTTQDIEWK